MMQSGSWGVWCGVHGESAVLPVIGGGRDHAHWPPRADRHTIQTDVEMRVDTIAAISVTRKDALFLYACGIAHGIII